jgi:hypothetical protein
LPISIGALFCLHAFTPEQHQQEQEQEQQQEQEQEQEQKRGPHGHAMYRAF